MMKHDPRKWDLRYLRLAQHVSEWSKDPSTKVGAVAAGRNERQIALGYNGFPPGIADEEDRLRDKGTKYALMQHAERNVLDNATFDLTGATLAVTQFPCLECAKSIISKRIARVITVAPPAPVPERPWTMTCKLSMELFAEAGVQVIQL